MKHINTRPEYAAAVAQLDQLVSALTGAESDYDRLTTALSVPEERGSELEAAKALIAGKPTHRTDTSGLNRQRAEVADKLAILRPAVAQQRVIVSGLRDELSIAVCNDAEQPHAKATQAIADAIEQLGQALAAEVAHRGAIEAAGYRCTLPAMACPDHLELHDAQSLARQFQRECANYATDISDRAAGRLDKPTTVKLLTKTEHREPGDVVTVPGIVARMLHRLSRVEQTTAKPHRVPRLKPWESQEPF